MKKKNAKSELESRLGTFGKYWLNEIWTSSMENDPLLQLAAWQLCSSLDSIDQATRELQEQGTTISDKYGKTTAHPAIRLKDDSNKACLAALKFMVANGGKVNEELDSFIKEVTRS